MGAYASNIIVLYYGVEDIVDKLHVHLLAIA